MKYALIIGNNKYDDQKLAQLKTPAADSQALAKVLGDKAIGSFDEVTPLVNPTEGRVRRSISTFLADKKSDDLVLLYFSGHGVLDDRGRLYLALKDTQFNLLKATSIPASFIADEMDSCRSKRQILILDCCHSGAFARGTKGEQKAITETTFEGNGFGRVVLTASDSTQYALEGDQVIKQSELSLFTHFLLEGLRTGEADTNNDGHISLDEWYDYTYEKVISQTPRQIPQKWSYNQQGDLLIARNPYLKPRVIELPYELIQALESPFVGIRESAVTEVGKYLGSRDSEMVNHAVSSLEKMKADDSRRISVLAERLLTEFEQAHTPTGKVTLSKTTTEMEPGAEKISSDGSMPSPKMSAETEPAAAAQKSQPVVEKVNLPIAHPSAPQGLVFNTSFWLKWFGTTVAAVLFSSVFYTYTQGTLKAPADPLNVVGFVAVAGLSSLIQWFVFRDRLKIGWVGINAIAGIVLGLLHNYLYEASSNWWSLHLGILLAVWIVGNFALGRTLVGETQEKSNQFSSAYPARSGAGLIGMESRQNVFLILLAISLVFSAFYTFVFALDLSDLLKPPLILYAITAILVGISFVLKKEIPRNFGFITLAVFLFLDGINSILYAFNPDSPLYFLYTLTGIISLASGIYFVFQRQILKNIGFLMLAGYLISLGLAYFFIMELPILKTFFVISAIFAIPAAIFLFLRK